MNAFGATLLLLTCLTQWFSGNLASTNKTKKMSETGEYRLHETFFNGRDTEVRPVVNDSSPIKVEFHIALHQILEVKEKEESLAISVFTRTYWKDEFMVWEPNDYNGIKEINVKPERLWVPDITLQNSIDREGDVRGNLEEITKKVIVKSDGSVKWLGNAILTSKCPMNIRYFPFDTQECVLKFSSWVYDGSRVDLFPKDPLVDIYPFSNHTEWKLLSAKQVRIVKHYNCCPEPFPEVHIILTLQRRPMFYVLNMILPIVLIIMLTLLAFYVPSDSGERISFGVTLLLAMTLFMLLLADMIPAASDNMSLMGIFFTLIIIEMVAMVFAMCYISRMYHKSPEEGRIYPWMRKVLFDNLSFVFGVRKKRGKLRSGKCADKMLAYMNPKDDSHSDVFDENNVDEEEEEQEDQEGLDEIEETAMLEKEQDSTSIGKEEVEDTDSHKNSNEYDDVETVTDELKRRSRFQSMGLSIIRRNQWNEDGTRKKQPANFSSTVTSVMRKNNEALLKISREEKRDKMVKYEWRVCAMTMDYVALVSFSTIFVVVVIAIVSC